MPTSTGKIYLGSTLVAGDMAAGEWTRNAAWPALTPPGPAEQRIVGLHAVWPGDGVGNGGNFFAFRAQGNYTINFGDGTTTNYTSNTRADYEFNFNAAALNGTNAPVTFTAATSRVNRTAHGLSNGAVVRFYGIVTTTGIVESHPYFVINATPDTFQIALTTNGSAVTFSGNGSATLLPYKIAIVTITPQAGQNLTVVNFLQKHGQTNLANNYSTGWLDLVMAIPQVSGANLTISALGGTVHHGIVERIHIVSVGALTTMAAMFNGCQALQSLPSLPNATAVTDMSRMFLGCSSLRTIPPFQGSVAAVTNMFAMFSGCRSLRTIPPFPGSVAAVADMSFLFEHCAALQSIPAFPGSVAAVEDMTSMFQGCRSLLTIPVFPSALTAVFSMADMFRDCTALRTIPPFPGSFTVLESLRGMFAGCFSLETIPPFPSSTATVFEMDEMFRDCSSLKAVPAFPSSTAAVQGMANMFTGCRSLQAIPPMNTAGVTSASGFTSAFLGASLARIQATGQRFSFACGSKLSAVALNQIFTGLATVAANSQTITVTGNYGVNQAGYTPSIATSKGWIVTA